MKKITLLLLSCVLLATACNQSSTNPNNPAVPACTSINTVYFEISFNGKTLKSNAYEYLGLKAGVTAQILPNSSGGESSVTISAVSTCPNASIIGNLVGGLTMMKTGSPSIGAYYNNIGTSGFIGDVTNGTPKSYNIKDSTLSANVTSITSDYVTGTFSCILKDATTEYPATGSFNVLRMN